MILILMQSRGEIMPIFFVNFLGSHMFCYGRGGGREAGSWVAWGGGGLELRTFEKTMFANHCMRIFLRVASFQAHTQLSVALYCK